jgi:hypothetical protein
VIVLHRAARSELRRAIAWYEDQQPTLGEDLAAEVNRALAAIAEAPLRWPTWRLAPRVRRFVLRRFPFAVAYVVRDAAPPLVIAFAHTSRSAERWLSRIGAPARPTTTRRRPRRPHE